MLKSNHAQTTIEEIANAVTHGIGAILSATALVILVIISRLENNTWKLVSSILFGITLIGTYSASTLYHAFRAKKIKQLFKIIDHAMIYCLIAGTYTPFTLVALHGTTWGFALFSVIWSLAIGGVIFKIFFIDRFEALSTTIYLLMGWLAIIAIKPICHALPPSGVHWLIFGGLSYTIGVIFYLWERLWFSHTIWHLFVLGGSTCHFIAISMVVI